MFYSSFAQETKLHISFFSLFCCVNRAIFAVWGQITWVRWATRTRWGNRWLLPIPTLQVWKPKVCYCPLGLNAGFPLLFSIEVCSFSLDNVSKIWDISLKKWQYTPTKREWVTASCDGTSWLEIRFLVFISWALNMANSRKVMTICWKLFWFQQVFSDFWQLVWTFSLKKNTVWGNADHGCILQQATLYLRLHNFSFHSFAFKNIVHTE